MIRRPFKFDTRWKSVVSFCTHSEHPLVYQGFLQIGLDISHNPTSQNVPNCPTFHKRKLRDVSLGDEKFEIRKAKSETNQKHEDEKSQTMPPKRPASPKRFPSGLHKKNPQTNPISRNCRIRQRFGVFQSHADLPPERSPVQSTSADAFQKPEGSACPLPRSPSHLRTRAPIDYGLAPGAVDEDIDVQSEEMLVNMGPQHPSTHGVLRIVLRTDGEMVLEAVPHLGYLHRCKEKIARESARTTSTSATPIGSTIWRR